MKGEGEDRKEATLNIYIQVMNVLNARNIIGVYGFTGSPTDDGFLGASYHQSFIENKFNVESFKDLYTAKISTNGNNFALPRRVRLGIALNF